MKEKNTIRNFLSFFFLSFFKYFSCYLFILFILFNFIYVLKHSLVIILSVVFSNEKRNKQQ